MSEKIAQQFSIKCSVSKKTSPPGTALSYSLPAQKSQPSPANKKLQSSDIISHMGFKAPRRVPRQKTFALLTPQHLHRSHSILFLNLGSVWRGRHRSNLQRRQRALCRDRVCRCCCGSVRVFRVRRRTLCGDCTHRNALAAALRELAARRRIFCRFAHVKTLSLRRRTNLQLCRLTLLLFSAWQSWHVERPENLFGIRRSSCWLKRVAALRVELPAGSWSVLRILFGIDDPGLWRV